MTEEKKTTKRECDTTSENQFFKQAIEFIEKYPKDRDVRSLIISRLPRTPMKPMSDFAIYC